MITVYLNHRNVFVTSYHHVQNGTIITKKGNTFDLLLKQNGWNKLSTSFASFRRRCCLCYNIKLIMLTRFLTIPYTSVYDQKLVWKKDTFSKTLATLVVKKHTLYFYLHVNLLVCCFCDNPWRPFVEQFLSH